MRLNKPWILTAIGCVGVVCTAFIAATESKRVCAKLDDVAGADTGRFKKIGKTVLNYKFTIISGVLTITSVILGQRASTKIIVSLGGTAAYALANRDNLIREVKSYVPDDAYSVAQRNSALRSVAMSHRTIEETGNGDVLCIEGYSGRLFRSSLEAVEDAMRTFADRFESGEYVNFNDLYDLLEIETTHFGDQWGYAPGSDLYDLLEPFSYEVTDISAEDHVEGKFAGERIIVIDIYTYPMEYYMSV